MTLHVGGDDWLYQNGYLGNFGAPVLINVPRFRYAGAQSEIHIPALGETTPLEIALALNAWSPEGARRVSLRLNDQPLRVITNGDWKIARIVVTDTTRLNPNHFVLALASDTFVPHEYDAHNASTAELGAAVESLTVTPRASADAPWWSQWTTPAWEFMFIAGLIATFAYAASALSSAPRVGLLFAILIVLFFGGVLAFARATVVSYIAPVCGVTLIILYLIYDSRHNVAPVSLRQKFVRWILLLGIVCIAWGTRLALALELPLSGDEQIYVPVSAHYADALWSGRWFEILTSGENFEHPIFAKLLFAVANVVGKSAGGIPELFSARFASLIASTTLAAVLAFVNPLAAASFAIHSIQIQYASQAYLEAVPALTIALAMICFDRARARGTHWLCISAVCLGLTAASKYIYAVAGFAILPFLIWRYRRAPSKIFLYGMLALVAFFAADPILWTNPFGNFLQTLRFHQGVSSGELVNSYARPFYWHLLYLTRLAEWDAGLPYFSFDTIIFIAGILGLPALWRTSRVYFAWFVAALIFLLLWNTKWEQYTLTLITPLCLSAGSGLKSFGKWLVERFAPGKYKIEIGWSARETGQRVLLNGDTPSDPLDLIQVAR